MVMERNHFSLQKHTWLSQKVPADLELSLNVFYQHLRELFEEHNMDKLPMVFDTVLGSTIHCKVKGLDNWWQIETFYFLSHHEWCW